jgi:glycosyltransferase involved in cell wall biosynthesis
VSQGANGHAALARSDLLSLVVSTYEWPEALDAVLRSLADQSDRRFQVIVADDGSGATTANVTASWRPIFGTRLLHVWHRHEGPRQALARNRGGLAATGRYLVFLDGDSIPRRHFVRAMRATARAGWFVAGRKVQLSAALTERVLKDGVPVHRRTLYGWLRQRGGAPLDVLTPRDRRRVGTRRCPEFEPRDRAYGFLLGMTRSDFRRVNGFDTRFVGWGEEDVDIAVRLRRLGLRCGHAGPKATVLHLWHPPRAEPDRPNWLLLQQTESNGVVEALEGLGEVEVAFAPTR